MTSPEVDIHTIRIVVAEDHHVVRKALVAYLRSQPWAEIVAEQQDGQGLMELIEREKPDVLLMDAEMPNHEPVEFVEEVRERVPEVKVLVLSAHSSAEYVVGLFRAGVAGYVMKNDSPEALLASIRSVAKGNEWVSPQAAQVLAEWVRGRHSYSPANRLTDREREVLAMMARGCRNDDIAESLIVSEHTVRNHVANIFSKLGVKTRVEAVLYALSFDILPFEEMKKTFTRSAAQG
ncbi:MAG: response regulator [Candidatus Promineifilaceae bacterium]